MKNRKKLGHYLALTVGAGAAATSAEGATTVTVYGSGVTPPAGINPFAFSRGGFVLDRNGEYNSSRFATSTVGKGDPTLFTRGTDLSPNGSWYDAYFGLDRFGTQSGDANYANITLNGNDGVYEAVGQFHISLGEVWLIALAKNSDNSALSISAGKAAIDAAGTSPVPEVSSHLALLALGSAGVLTRRRLKRAA